MKVSIDWLKQLIELNVSIDKVINLLPLRTVGTKEVTPVFFELDMKGYNRPDLLSMRGVAQEISAITDSKIIFSEPEENEYIWAGSFDKLRTSLPKTDILVENNDLCPIYCIAKIEGLKVAPSSIEWIKKLNDCGMRTVNNVADVTNLVMLEYGQPLHSFDADIVKDGKIVVRIAKKGEKIVTLDNKTRDLEASDLLITDPEKALGIAGVMGGKNSEISDSTITIFLESAIFDPINLRKTATRLNLQSEASKRFQHGLTKKRCLQALNSAIKMYQDLGGKLTTISITGDLEDKQKTITLRKSQLDSLIGIEIPEKDVVSYLKKLNFEVLESVQGEALRAYKWEIVPPYYRLDVEIEADVIEEVARMYGYEKLPSKELAGKIPEKIDQSLFTLINNVKENLAEIGLNEVQTYSFYSTEVIENCKFDTENLIKIANPMSSQTQFMRDMLWPNLLKAVAKNLKSYDQVAIFEINKIYIKGPEPKEEYHLALALSNDNPENIKQLYGLFKSLGIYLEGVKLNLGGQEITEREKELFHPVRFWYLLKENQKIGMIAEVHPRIVNKFGVEKRVSILEIRIKN
ncbi:MAG: phenylalanine--tRNA ligase subunit beta [Candidatus Daviesbacteria bacterium]|nr:phenylalanine--tRNA ligase subunit beta [Candidatus Daviesbacteria bacterium]